MALPHSTTSVAGFVSGTPNNGDTRGRHVAPVTRLWDHRTRMADAVETARQRRARRQALGLMAISGLVSITGLYGLWVVLHGLM